MTMPKPISLRIEQKMALKCILLLKAFIVVLPFVDKHENQAPNSLKTYQREDFTSSMAHWSVYGCVVLSGTGQQELTPSQAIGLPHGKAEDTEGVWLPVLQRHCFVWPV